MGRNKVKQKSKKGFIMILIKNGHLNIKLNFKNIINFYPHTYDKTFSQNPSKLKTQKS